MTEIFSAVLIVLGVAAVVMLGILLRRKDEIDSTALNNRLDSIKSDCDRIESSVKTEVANNREEGSRQAREMREELRQNFKESNDSLMKQLESFSRQLIMLIESNEKKIGDLTTGVDTKLNQIQQDNASKLEQMRQTVDEKLQGTLEKRLTESFKFVSDRLEQVHKGLGEMQTLAIGVGDLKKVLTNVKIRGTWAEMQLGNLLEQILTAEQYAKNVITKQGGSERVEFAIKLPGRDDLEGKVVWLPIDAKFPKEDYERLVAASEKADLAGVEAASADLEIRIKLEAKNIRDKYLDPPNTTDFGILFLPTEGLYAEMLRRPALVETLQLEYRVNVTGPTTLAALLNSLQMGFRTLAIQRRSSEVWTLLSAIKTEFGKFGDVMEKVQKKLQEASNVIDQAAARTRAIERKLRNVQDLPPAEAAALLDDGASSGIEIEPEGPDLAEAEQQRPLIPP